MLNFNLNKTKSSVSVGGETQSTGMAPVGSTLVTNLKGLFGGAQTIDASIIVKVIINTVLIFCFPLALKIYEVTEIGKLELEKQKKDKALAEVEGRLSKLSDKIKSYAHVEDKAEEFKNKKEILKKLAAVRLTIPLTLDFIQNRTPKNVWLKSIDLEVAKGKKTLKISGESFTEDHVNFFASSMNDILDRNSVAVDMKDVKASGGADKISFNLSAQMKE